MALENPLKLTRIEAIAEKGNRSPEEPQLSQKMELFAEELRAKGLQEEAGKLFEFAREAALIEKESRTDELTGLLNRRGFSEEWNRYVELLKREREKDVHISSAFMALDLDNFKLINDNYGHAAGDRFLRLFAERVGPILRSTDVFGRVGGDEFSVFLMDSSTSGAERAASSVRTAVEGIHETMREEYPGYTTLASVSVGIVTIDGEGHIGDDQYTTLDEHPALDQIKDYADYAMYVVKKKGGKGAEATLQSAWNMDKDGKLHEAYIESKKIREKQKGSG